MAAMQTRATDIHAFAAIAELEVYEARINSYVRYPQERGGKNEVSRHFERLRISCARCAELTVPWLGLMISHCELLARVDEHWDAERGEHGARAVLSRHDACVQQLALACRRLLQRQPSAPGQSAPSQRRRARRVTA